jgi:UDP-N-acetylglucosamine--N-acetylmuramyl-(pentapeptide) pyrophosphoryl-undecaprenol N-acetylglucosamine transferase
MAKPDNRQKRSVLLVCERSAGHIFPALSVGAALKKGGIGQNDVTVCIYATAAALQKHISDEGFLVLGKCFSSRNIIVESLWRFFEAFYILLKTSPKLVVGFGGRDTLFLVIFSIIFGIKTAIYEPNVTYGKANKFLASFAGRVWRGLAGAEKSPKVEFIGVPLRKNIKKVPRQKARSALGFSQGPVVLCFGGSQGSSFINNFFKRYVENSKQPFAVIHITGEYEYFQIKEFYNKIGRESLVKPFHYNIEDFYNAADLVVSRAGAVTVSELIFYKLPAVIVPHPSAYGHQKENAGFLAACGGAFVCEQGDSFYSSFSRSLTKMIVDDDLRRQMSEALVKIKGGVVFEDFYQNFNDRCAAFLRQ